jgi:23S rRNA pseudouridine1911/1915/1917 synthase
MQYNSESTERLDKFLAGVTGKSRGLIQKAIKNGEVKVEDKTITETDHKVLPGQTVESPEFKEKEFEASTRELKIVYENNDLAVIDKPAGLVVHPGAGTTEDTLVHALLKYFPDIKNVGQPHRPGIVHRLDEDTSGLLLIAKTSQAYEFLKAKFMERQIDKQYLALVHGVPKKLHDIIDAPLAKNFRGRKMNVGEGKEAVTEYSVLATNEKDVSGLDQMALLRVKLHTGRTHQIRAHLAHINHPIVGDQTYGGTYKQADMEVLNRQFLHAYHLRFELLDGTWIELESELPDDLKEVLKTFKIVIPDSIGNP